ncbi:MAG: bifunctional ADP-heptose synthase [candidate division NC10 bacterium]|nr:bifunctional ADP-heptose synthase [candidate division NC10 bacterium]
MGPGEQVRFGWEGKRVFVVGDVMLDIYRRGRVIRLSPEAPVPIILNPAEELCLGGAGNIARNIAALKAEAVLAACVGRDAEGSLLGGLAESAGIACYFFEEASRPTTTKTRIIGLPAHQHICRIDREETFPILEESRQWLLKSGRKLAEQADIIIVSDYRKGVIFPGLVAELARSGKKVIVDPKGPDISLYRGAWAIVPNWAEAEELVGTTDGGNIDWVGKSLCSASGCEWVIVTRHGEGASVYSHELTEHIPAQAKKVVDTTGAGDTFTAVFSLGIAAGMDGIAAARIANQAAGIVVGKLGTAFVELDELRPD